MRGCQNRRCSADLTFVSDRYRQPWDDLLKEITEVRALAAQQVFLLQAILDMQEQIKQEIMRAGIG